MDLGLPGRAARPMGSPRDRRAVAHSGWGSQACSLSVDVVQRQRHAAILFFANGGRRRRRWRARMDLAPPGRAVAAATCGVAARAPLTLIAAGAAATYGVAARSPGCCAQRLGLRRALYPLTWCSGSGTRRFSFSRMAAGAAGDGARGWTSRRRGERSRRPPAGSRREPR